MNCALLVCSLLMAALVVGTFGIGVMLFVAALDAHNSTSDDVTTKKPSRFKVGDDVYYKHKLGLSDSEADDDGDVESATSNIDDKVREARGQHTCRTPVNDATLMSENQSFYVKDRVHKEITGVNDITVVSTVEADKTNADFDAFKTKSVGSTKCSNATDIATPRSDNNTIAIDNKVARLNLGFTFESNQTRRDEKQQATKLNDTATENNATLRQGNEIVPIGLEKPKEEATVPNVRTENETTSRQEDIDSSDEFTTSSTISSNHIEILITERDAAELLDVEIINNTDFSNSTLGIDNRTGSIDELEQSTSNIAITSLKFSDNETLFLTMDTALNQTLDVY